MTWPPRSDHVGSLLRPPSLRGVDRDDAVTLRAAEDAAISEAVSRQQECGIDVVSDGEFRREGFLTGFMDAVGGFGDNVKTSWRGGSKESWSMLRDIVGPMSSDRRIAQAEAAYLRELAPGRFKITLPTPCSFAMSSWRADASAAAFPTRRKFLESVTEILAREVRMLASEEVPYLQIDAPNYTWWADENQRTRLTTAGIDLDSFLDEAIAADNIVLAGAGDAVTGVHLCRGNLAGRWLAEGGYDAVAERLFNKHAAQRLLLEYDTDRAGSFAPLRYVPRDKTVVLGLVSSKTGVLESRDTLMRRIDEASKYLPLDRFALSPQCGFSSGGDGNPLSLDEQWKKLALVAEVASEVWP